MTGSNKILTVSYGTFSCTLEGFDEPFDAMRGIAEYFRDLAADDRYFGAEPPTPDPEMLQTIAQREVHRRVEARTSDLGIALTQSPSAQPAPEKVPAAPKGDAGLDEGPLTYDDEFLMSDEPEDVLTVDENTPPAEESDRVETVAEKLRRIRAVVSRSIEPEEATEPFSQAPDASIGTGAAAANSRAKTRTIDAITADLSDEDAFNDDPSDILDDTLIGDDDLADLERLDAASDQDQPDNALADDGADDDPDDTAENAFAAEDEYDDEQDNTDALIANVMSADTGDASPIEPTDENAKARSPIGDTDESVDRLLKETDNQFADGGSIRRRRVISQMRAAVAATKAERVLTRLLPDTEVEESTLYRNDLKRVITRPIDFPKPKDETPKAEEKAPEAAKPAPLVLVSSQRVDTKDAAPKAPTEETESFRDFARNMGAEELPDLLEAAAAYASFVEGHEHFTRPEIMKRVAAVDPALEISREAGLRSFGQLLRQGKIRKLDRGQFAIDEETRFNPGARIAGE